MMPLMAEQETALRYGRSPKRRGARLIIAGACLMVLAFAMAVVGASIFVMTTTPSRGVYWLGAICFFGYVPTGLAGLVLLIVGLVLFSRSRG